MGLKKKETLISHPFNGRGSKLTFTGLPNVYQFLYSNILLNSQNNPMRLIIISSPLYRGGSVELGNSSCCRLHCREAVFWPRLPNHWARALIHHHSTSLGTLGETQLPKSPCISKRSVTVVPSCQEHNMLYQGAGFLQSLTSEGWRSLHRTWPVM